MTDDWRVLEIKHQHAAVNHRVQDKRYPYPSPFNDYPPPSERELERLRESMREAKAVLAAWADSERSRIT